MKQIMNDVVNEIALNVVSSLDISKRLSNIQSILSSHMPVDEMIFFWLDDVNDTLQMLIRINKKGNVDQSNLQTFLLENFETGIMRDLAPGNSQNLWVYTRNDLENKIRIPDFKKYAGESNISPDADLLMLFDRELQTGLVLVSSESTVFTKKHFNLFEQLMMPLQMVMANALRFKKISYMHDALADENRLFREATVRLTGETDISKGFRKTIDFLSIHEGVEQIALFSMDEGAAEQKVLLRVHADGTMEESVELVRIGDQFSSGDKTGRHILLEHLPDVFITEFPGDDFQNGISIYDLKEQMHSWGIVPEATMIVLGVKAIQAGLLFVFAPGNSAAKCKHAIQILKEPFIISLHNAIRFFEQEELRTRLAEENHELLIDIQREVGDRVIGMHNGLKHVMTLATQVAKKPSPVLLMGETGTGKEVVATAIHRISDRNNGPFISLNCGAIPETLVDSELFGHEKGAFTGANERKRGRFERADGGTLFLDEIGELPASAQVKLLRVLQEKEFERVGGSHSIRANVRLIAATNRNLPDMIRKGLFREDLWFRLNVFPIEIPPLRQRREDIIPLAYFFIETKIRQLNIPFQPALPAEELDKLVQYDWPGNVRELQNTIERALILCRGEPLHFPLLNSESGKNASYIPSSLSKSVTNTDYPSLKEATRTYLIELLHRTGGKIAGPGGAAEVSGLNPSTLRSKLKKLGIRKIETHV